MRSVDTVAGNLPVAQAIGIEVQRMQMLISGARNQTVAQYEFERARGWLDGMVWLGELDAEDRRRLLVEVLGPVLFKRLKLNVKVTSFQPVS